MKKMGSGNKKTTNPETSIVRSEKHDLRFTTRGFLAGGRSADAVPKP